VKKICAQKFTAPTSSASHKKFSLWLTAILMGFTLLACRVEIGFDPKVIAQEKTIIQPETGSPILPTVTITPIVTEAEASPSPTPTNIKIIEEVDTKSTEISMKFSPMTLTPTMVFTSIATTPTLTPTPSSTPVVPANSPPTKIIAPAINLDAPVAATSWTVIEHNGTTTSIWTIPDNSAGWHQNSALPGHGSNIVLSGHHNIGSEVFRHLVELEVGDEIILQADGYNYRYTVTDRFILLERGVSEEQRKQNAQWILPTIDERVTLVTCWPDNDNSHRLIVVAKPS
jgi:LPXTG-site transpeptidase (sortase) family protein